MKFWFLFLGLSTGRRVNGVFLEWVARGADIHKWLGLQFFPQQQNAMGVYLQLYLNVYFTIANLLAVGVLPPPRCWSGLNNHEVRVGVFVEEPI